MWQNIANVATLSPGGGRRRALRLRPPAAAHHLPALVRLPGPAAGAPAAGGDPGDHLAHRGQLSLV